MSRAWITTLLIPFILVLPVQAAECSTAFVCEVVSYQRMHLDGRLQSLPAGTFGFRMRGNKLVPQQDGSPLGDGTVDYDLYALRLCGADGRLSKNDYNDNYQFEGKNSLYTFEYLNGRLLISAHKHHDYFDLTAAECREL